MNWYYVQQGKQAGPVTDEQLDELVRSGTMAADTLVWHEGMAEWASYTQAKGGAASGASTPSIAVVAAASRPEAVCAECGKMFPLEETISHGNVRICAACKPVFLQKLQEGAAIGGTMQYAGFWIRVAAKLLDGLILGVPFMVVFMIVIFSQAGGGPQSFNNTSPTFSFAILILEFGFIFIQFGYQIFFLGKYGATLGKKACKIKVVTGEGEPINYLRATGRVFAEMLSGMICYIGYIMVGFDGQKRSLHDHICNTRVIYTNR